MKKLLIIFLFTIIFLNDEVLTQSLDELKKFAGNCKDIRAWLKEHELYDSFLEAYNKGGKDLLVKLCAKKYSEAICSRTIDLIIKCIKYL